MAKKKKSDNKTKNSKQRDPNTLEVTAKEEDDKGKAVARAVLRPSVNAGLTIKNIYKSNELLNVNDLIAELGNQMHTVYDGDLKRAEAMLVAQAHTLDTLFGEFTRRAINAEYMSNLKIFMNLALKAQSQCRATLEALAESKNPRPYIQNNRAQYQQVNNGEAHESDYPRNPHAHAHAGKNSKTANGLLEDKGNDGQWLDTRAQATASKTHKEMEAMEAKHWP